MKITIFVLHKTGEVYQKFLIPDDVVRWMARTGNLNLRTVIIQKGNSARVWDKINDLRELQKEMTEYFFQK